MKTCTQNYTSLNSQVILNMQEAQEIYIYLDACFPAFNALLKIWRLFRLIWTA